MIRVAIIGCGRVCQRYHLPFLAARPDLKLVGACDRDPERAAGLFAGQPGVWVGGSVREVLARAEPDVLTVCTPNHDHVPPALAALTAGVAVLCEKPLAARIDQARLLAARADGDPLVGVNLPYRFHELLPAFTAAVRDTVVTGIEFTMSTPGDRLWRACTPWHQDRELAGGGVLLDLGTHALDVLVTVFGPPRVDGCSLSGGAVEDRAELRMTFDGVPAVLRLDRAARTVAMALTAHTPAGPHLLDFRRGELRLADGTVQVSRQRPELAALTAFFNTVTGSGPGAVVTAGEALALQEIVTTAYRLAGV
ncbi:MULTISPECIES: Gfo/Idh/MocA family protein [unclassified Crossiella]|uniref:Gfo/Idh/MocA family protein n=1 Tax=unclassified Crossiella TaxID=2620835 RepID=UPI001FFFEBF8|nr:MULTISPECIES: Gfo/Idh/MocA family oxidoreductase [unclassified Crossiella]MCK2244370.1 Gfo/Idh/MocA family oxidoreductase [Crossiella sp. S99.2]MCK2257802.1 Gfo/Idh/MocA family oxidoreductase [Crossiella sp. S99.1]